MAQPTVITGMGVLSPNGIGLGEYRDALRAGRSGIRRMDHLDTSAYETRIAGYIDESSIETLWSDKKGRSRRDRITVFSSIVADMAWADSGLAVPAEPSGRKGVIVGTGCGTAETAEYSYYRFFKQSNPFVKPTTVPRGMFNAAAGEIGIKYGLRAINNTVATACSSALVALLQADLYIRCGLADLIIVCGVDCPIHQAYFHIWDSLRVMTRDHNEDPERGSRPFSLDRSGMVLSEGAAAVILESAEHAARRNASVYARVLGTAQSNDAYHVVAPLMETQAHCMSEALAAAGLPPASIDHIQAHGTSTVLNDVTETQAIRHAFGDAAMRIPVSSIKSMIGHTLGASGLHSLIGVLLGMQDGYIAPTINLDTPDPECDLDYVPNASRSAQVRTAMVNAFGFGGTNVSVVVEKSE